MTHYLIEQMGRDGRWFSVGTDPVSGWAQHYARKRQALFPDQAVRVVEMPGARLIVCMGGKPLGE